jgi:hypothetical protein
LRLTRRSQRCRSGSEISKAGFYQRQGARGRCGSVEGGWLLDGLIFSANASSCNPGGSAFIPGSPTVCALVSCKRCVTLLRFCPIYSPPTIHYSLLTCFPFADRLERTQTQDPPSKTGDGAPSA